MSSQAGKKGKKKGKGKTVSLNDFLGDTQGPGIVKQIDWADEAEEEYRSVNSSLAYQSTSAPKIIQLPTAPRAARTVEIDHSRIPEHGPFTAFVGNLPYEVDQYMLEEFFKDMPIVNVRLPEENGRFKGFGYVQFEDRQSLIKALEMNEETLQKRNIKIDIADNQTKDGGRGSYGRSGDRYGSQSSGPDPTEGNWRTKPQTEEESTYRDDFDGGNGYRKASRDYDNYDRRYSSDRQGGYGSRGFEDRSRGGYNDRGYERPRFGGNRSYDRQGYDKPREDEAPRERPTLRLQPRQKPLDDSSKATTRSSSIFGSAKPVDTTVRERAMEEKLDKQQKNVDENKTSQTRSSSIFGSAKPVDTTVRERAMEEKLDKQQKSSSIFGSAKPVDTTVRERAMEEKLDKQQKSVDENKTSQTRSSSIFGSAKPVDTTVRERAMEEKLDKQQKSVDENKTSQQRSANIFGGAKPIDTTAREKEIEEKIAARNERLMSASKQAQQPPVSARASVFGNAKPVDTSAREKEIEEKLRKREEDLMQTVNKEERDTDRRSRLSSQRSDDRGPTSPRRSRTSSVKSSEDQMETGSTSSRNADKKSAPKPATPQYKPAPAPKENAWGKKILLADKPAAAATPKPQSTSEQKSAKSEQRGEREEAEGSREEEERMPEGAADEERAITSRNEPGDGSEERYNSSSRRDGNRYRSDRTNDSYPDRNRGAKYVANRQGSNQYRNRNYSDEGHRENRRRGDGDSQSYRGGGGGSGYANNSNSTRNKRDSGSRNKNRNERTEKRRDSSRDSRPECDRVDGAGQEQPTVSGGKSGKSKPKMKQAEKEEPENYVSESKFAALLSMEDNDDNVDVD